MTSPKYLLLAASLTFATVPTVAVAQTTAPATTTAPHKSFLQRHPKTSILLGAAGAYLLYRKLHPTCPPLSNTQAMNNPKYAKCFPTH